MGVDDKDSPPSGEVVVQESTANTSVNSAELPKENVASGERNVENNDTSGSMSFTNHAGEYSTEPDSGTIEGSKGNMKVDTEVTEDTMDLKKAWNDIEAPDVEVVQQRSYASFSHRTVALMLKNAASTGALGSGPREKDVTEFSLVATIMASLPWGMLVAQAVWSAIVMLVAYGIGKNRSGGTELPTLGVEFWTSRYVISTSIVDGVGWALFVLLGFFIREAAGRYREAGLCWSQIKHYCRQIVRHLVQAYPKGTWHEGDMERIMAHLIAYPVALKMTLRGEREAAQLAKILHPDDVADVLAAESMHLHCMRVVRSYQIAAEDDATSTFETAAKKTPAGWGTRYLLFDIIDAVDMAAGSACRIADFKPSVGYVNHLRIFMYIWFFFLPLSIVATSGWFTVLWSVLITYGIGMLYVIAHALNEPYGYDAQDIKLNRLSAETALVVLDCYSKDTLELPDLIRSDHSTPMWLEAELSRKTAKEESTAQKSTWIGRLIPRPSAAPLKRNVLVPVLIFTAWISFVVFLTWGLSRGEERPPTARWWYVYIPVSSSTTTFVGLGIFLLLSFWMGDAYGRYWTGLQTWQTSVRTHLETVALQVALCCKPGLWHPRDRERFFSFLTALPIALKHHLRDSRNLSELEEILSPQDLAAISEASDFPQHCLHVIHGYINSVDRVHKETLRSGTSPLRHAIYTIQYTLWAIEIAIEKCEALRKFPISESFTTHLNVFAVFWLALLPLTTVLHDGFFSFLYLIPIGYSIIKLLTMGRELADPFGYDFHDIPVDMFCEEIKDSIHEIYHLTLQGPSTLVKESPYEREKFAPQYLESKIAKLDEGDENASGRDERQSSLRGSIRNIIKAAPSVNIKSQLAVTAWSVIAVLLSYAFSFTWGDRRDLPSCRAWCSPIDVNGSVLSNIGFALFMILSFRAYDSIARYEDGAQLIYTMEDALRSLACEMLQAIRAGVWHPQDQERIVAHLAQIPLVLSDALLGKKRTSEEKEGLLSEDDRNEMEQSSNEMDHCLRVLETYLLTMDSVDPDYAKTLSDFQSPHGITANMFGKVSTVRQCVYKALSTKRFPVVRSYTQHQGVFTAIWLILLPLSMTAQTGWFTILWAPIISYGVLALESIAVKLVDPFGTDDIDLPVEQLCSNASSAVLDAVHSIQWGCARHIRQVQQAEEPGLGIVLRGKTVYEEYRLAHLNAELNATESNEELIVEFDGPREFKEKPSLYAHILRSVPWWVLLYVIAWNSLAVIISYVTRDRSQTAEWWISRISLDGNVAAYVSFAAFLLLGFYVQAAFARYDSAGGIWGDNLRSACHALAAQWVTLQKPGTWHEGDHERVIAHIAAIPLALKLEMRDSRDIRELKGLLSPDDIGQLQMATSMAKHCLDVVRSYYLGAFTYPELLNKPESVTQGSRTSIIKFEINQIEKAIMVSQFIKKFGLAPGFLVLLRTMLIIWFTLLPFYLAEISGWWTILWVPTIAYGLLGMYAVAAEIQHPFGVDLNDFDLDSMANSISKDVIDVYQRLGYNVIAAMPEKEAVVAPMWQGDHPSPGVINTPHSVQENDEERENEGQEESGDIEKKRRIRAPSYFWEMWRLARNAVPYWILGGACLWASFAVLLSWLTRNREQCDPWWCSPIDVHSSVKGYVGFALFLLLGFRLYDSHGRYVSALRLWRDGIQNFTRLLVNRFYQSVDKNTFHKGDLERIAGHLAAYAIVTVSRLRNGENCESDLRQVLSEEDVARVLEAREKPDYCIDVVRAYLVKGDELGNDGKYCAGSNEQWIYCWYLMKLRLCGAECERIVRMPLPFGYVQHLRIFLLIWLLLLPLGLVRAQGPFTVIWCVLIAYGVVGIERWSAELANPFGHDLSDVPLDQLKKDVIEIIQTNLKVYEDGTRAVIKTDRPGFPTTATS